MALIRWDNSLSVDVEEIDNQHKKLVVFMNELHDAIRNRQSNRILGETIDGLIAYAKEHFTTEEKYFEEFEYVNMKKHKQEHTDFINKIADFKTGFDEKKLSVSTDLIEFLVYWFITHLQGSDRDYIECFKKHGLITTVQPNISDLGKVREL